MTTAAPGAQMPTHRRVLKTAIPIVLANATVPILGVVDTGVVGQLGEAAPIGGVGIGAVILLAIYWFFGFLRMGTTGLVSQARGAGDSAEMAALFTRAILIAGAGGLMLILLQVPLFWGAFQVAPASDEVEELARAYLHIRIWSAPFAIAIYGITGWLVALERSRAVLILQLFMNGLNIVLDLWFVLGLGWGVEGVAIATVIAEVLGCLWGLYLCRDVLRGQAWCNWPRVFDRARLIHMFQVNTDIMIRSVIMLGIFVSFAFYGSSLGDVPLAANQILMQFVEVTAYALDGFAFAAEAIVGSALGAKARNALRRGVLLAGFWAGVAALLMSLGFALFGPMVIDAMATSEAVRAEARIYLPWMVAVPILGLMAWVLDGVFIGATQSRDMRNMMILSVAVYAVSLSIFLPLWGNHGLWAALVLSYVVRGLTLLWKYPKIEAAASA